MMFSGLMRSLKGVMLKRMHGMITCREFEDFVLSYLEGELPHQQIKTFERHLWVCRECRDYLAAYQRAIEVGKKTLGLPDERLPAEVPEDLIKAIIDSRKN